MKVVVLGASGQVGSVIYNALQHQHDVIGTSRKQGAEFLQFDPLVDDWSVLGKIDVLVNCIGQIDATDHSFEEIHLGLTRLIVKNRELVGSPRIIQISALGASAGHKVEFLRTKGLADDYLLTQPDTVVVRPSIVCTHRTTIIKKLLIIFEISKYTNRVVLVPKGFLGNRIQPVMPTELAALVNVLCSLEELPKVVNATGPESNSYRQLVEIMFRSRSKSFRIQEVSRTVFDLVVKYVITPLFPNLINAQQYRLLFDNNMADNAEFTRLIGSAPTSCALFFINEFKDAGH
jgi:uncharacterized protein YbjT (DUF2867 family)